MGKNIKNFRIENIIDEVLKDTFFDYFEWLSLEVTISEDKGEIQIKYTLLGKYSHRIFKLRMSDYYDMFKYQKAHLEWYHKILKSELDLYIRAN